MDADAPVTSPADPGGMGHPAALTPAKPITPATGTTSANIPTTAADQPVYDTNHKVHDPKQSAGGGLLSKLKTLPSINKGNTTQPALSTGGQPPSHTVQNVPTVPGEETVPLVPGGKDTRFSDTVHVAPTPVTEDDTSAATGGIATVLTPDGKPHNKLKKNPSGGVVTTPGAPPPGSVLGDGSTGMPTAPATFGTTVVPETTWTGSATGKVGKSQQPKPADIPILEEITLPDGTKAYVRHGTAPAVAPASSVPVSMPADRSAMPVPEGAPATLSKKDKQKDKMDASSELPTAGHHHIPAENQMGMGHCAMCCPSGPKDASGRPIYPCAHQDGLSGPSAMDRAKVASAGDPANAAAPPSGGKKKSSPPFSSLNDVPGSEPAIVVQENVQTVPDGAGGGNKLKKGNGPATMSNEEEAMEDARKLAGELMMTG